MKIVVLKFGGTSVGTIEKIKKISRIIGEFRKKKFRKEFFRNPNEGNGSLCFYKRKW